MAYRSVKAMVSFFEETHIDYIVHAGTLLQLYRDCDINGDANDIDFAIPLEKLTMSLKHDLVDKLGLTYLYEFGTEGQMGYEMSFKDRNSVKIDIFSLNCNPDGFCWTPLWISKILHRCGLFPVYPIAELCIGEDTLRIPSYPSTFLEQLYGSKWRHPIATRKWGWQNPFCKVPVVV
jgi:hypothetical protein